MTDRPGPDNRYSPDCVTPPGFFIAEKLDEIRISLQDLAGRTGYSADLLAELISGRGRIDQDLALKLESALAIPARFWLNAERQYRASQGGRRE